jgi:hypothetical protein
VKVFVVPGRLPTGVALNSAKVFGSRYYTSETLIHTGPVISQGNALGTSLLIDRYSLPNGDSG